MHTIAAKRKTIGVTTRMVFGKAFRVRRIMVTDECANIQFPSGRCTVMRRPLPDYFLIPRFLFWQLFWQLIQGGIRFVRFDMIRWREFSHCSSQTRSEEHTSELQSLMRISYAVFCLKKQKSTTSNAYT